MATNLLDLTIFRLMFTNPKKFHWLKWQNHLLKWMKGLVITEEMQEDGSVKQKMGEAAIDILNNLKSGSKLAFETLKTESSFSEKYAKENFDLITWFIVS